MDVRDMHSEAIEAFSAHVDGVPPGAWGQPTPCEGWDVRALVNHVVGENRWVPPLMHGSTVADVGGALDGDLLGDDPIAAWRQSIPPALEAAASTDLAQPVHLSFGDLPAEQYLWQLTCDALVHSWDLAHATDQVESVPAEVVEACAAWFDGAEDLYRSSGAIGARVEVHSEDPFAVLLGRFGRDPLMPRPVL